MGRRKSKSKNSSQRTKDGPKQQISTSNNQKQQQTAPVPVPQPQKPSSKTSKKSDINQKGANKEGTDMDAFNDNEQMDVVNANINNEINSNSMVITNSNNSTNVPTPNIDTNKKKHNQNNSETMVTTPAVKPEAKPLPKKIDITDIVKEKPKPIKPFPQQTSAQDEIDRAVPMSNEQLVQAKNEANAKVSSENNGPSIIETKPELPYREGQWTPNNVDGKKVYDKEFLLALKNGPASTKKPDNIPEAIIADERGRLSDGRYSMGGRTDFTNLPFPSYGGKSSSQRGLPPKRNSQSGKLGGGGGKSGSKSQQIKVSISVKEDVKLHESENAWKPARFLRGDNMTEEEKKTEELYKKVRGVLNKLTPQKFETLIGQVRELQIDNEQRLQGVIDLVFEKAVDEPNFSVAYALMCKELSSMEVPTSNSTEDKKEFAQFRKLIITRCQLEFEKQSRDESERKEKMKEISECKDAEKKKELQFDLEEHDRKLRMKSVGNIRFIGELFKQQMLISSIMFRCLNNLLTLKDEESLECFCKLLTTVGQELEKVTTNNKNAAAEWTEIFNNMKEIINSKTGKDGKPLSSRVRFMLQDVMDLKRNKWVSRRQDLNPKTMDQIQKEAENEQLNIQVMNAMTPRKDDRGSGSGGNQDRRRKNVSDDGWQTTPSSRSRTQFNIISDKMKIKIPQTDEPLGSSKMFGNWSKGSNIKSDVSSTTNTANMYAALENYDLDKRPSESRSKDPYGSSRPSLERSSYKQQVDGRGSRSGSQHRSIERERPLPTATQKIPQTTIPSAPKATAPVQQVTLYSLTDEELERFVKNNLEEYLNDSTTLQDYQQDTVSRVPPTYFPTMVADSYLNVLERSEKARKRTGFLFAFLIKEGVLSLDAYSTGLGEVLGQAHELQIDIPKFWTYLGECLVHLICEEALPLARLHKLCDVLQSGHRAKLYGPLFSLILSEKGANFLVSCWQASGLEFDSFLNPGQETEFLKSNNLECLLGGDTIVVPNKISFEKIKQKLTEFFSSKTEFDDVVSWITTNVGNLVEDNKFIRIFVTAIFENSIQRQKFISDNLKSHYKFFQKYVDNNSNYELQCLYALQALIHQMEHPKGVLLTICNQLYEDSIISQDSFIAWEISQDPCENEGKGVALKQLTSFFTQLKENEESGSASSSDEA